MNQLLALEIYIRKSFHKGVTHRVFINFKFLYLECGFDTDTSLVNLSKCMENLQFFSVSKWFRLSLHHVPISLDIHSNLFNLAKGIDNG